MGNGLATRYSWSMWMTHGNDRICLTGTCNFTLPMKPPFISIGNPKCLKASFLRGKFSNSTCPICIDYIQYGYKILIIIYLTIKLHLIDRCSGPPRIFLNSYSVSTQLILPTFLFIQIAGT